MPDLEINPNTAPSADPVPYDEEAASRAASQLAMDLADSIDAGCPMSVEEVVARIKAIPGNPAKLQRLKRTGPPKNFLYLGEREMEFDEEAWNREWAPIEAEINRLSRDR